MGTNIVNWIKKHQLIAFFVVTYLITFGVQFGFIYLDPGKPLQPWSLVWFFSVFGPSFSALIITGITSGMAGVKSLLSGFLRWKVGFRWYLAAAFLFLAPVVIALIYLALGNASPGPLPGETTASMLGTIIFTLFSGPLAEELGWRGFALPRLQEKYNALLSSLILGVIWTCWHIPLFFITGATQMSIPFPIYLVLVLTLTLYVTWLYNNTRGSLIITVLGHFLLQLNRLPDRGAALDACHGVLYDRLPSVGLLVVGMVIRFGPRYFSKKAKTDLPFQRLII